MAMGPLDQFMIKDNALSAKNDGFDLVIFSHWYRSLPLSCIGNITLSVDGEAIRMEEVQFEVNGKNYLINELPDLYKEWWFILDPMVLHIRRNGLVKKGKTSTVTLELGMLIPYVLVGPESKPMLSAGKITRQILAD
jgi:hypothetical protein